VILGQWVLTSGLKLNNNKSKQVVYFVNFPFHHQLIVGDLLSLYISG
jgi:hypothetical protein